MQNSEKIATTAVLLLLLESCWSAELSEAIRYVTVPEVRAKNSSDGAIFKLATSISLSNCAVMALQNRKWSFNFGHDVSDGTRGRCEILNSTMPIINLTPNIHVQWKYYYCETYQPMPEDPCDPNPCLYGANCIVNRTTKPADFQCNCTYPTGGKTCQDLVCQNCSRLNQLVIYVINDFHVAWSTARDNCVAKGYQLHMPKTAAIFNFTQRFMLNLYANHRDAKHAYWIGLTRKSSFAKFLFVDNTKLDTFQPWSPGRPGTDNCIEMPATYEFNFTWDDDPCQNYDGFDGWDYYYICEKYYPFFPV